MGSRTLSVQAEEGYAGILICCSFFLQAILAAARHCASCEFSVVSTLCTFPEMYWLPMHALSPPTILPKRDHTPTSLDVPLSGDDVALSVPGRLAYGPTRCRKHG